MTLARIPSTERFEKSNLYSSTQPNATLAPTPLEVSVCSFSWNITKSQRMCRLRRKLPFRREVLNFVRCSERKLVRGQIASSVGRVSGDHARWNTCFFKPVSNLRWWFKQCTLDHTHLFSNPVEDFVNQSIEVFECTIDNFIDVELIVGPLLRVLKLF